jgi:hypothetical protein
LSSVSAKIKRLKGLKMDEIGVRLAQRVAILSERSGWSKHGKLPSDEQLLSLTSAGLTSIADVIDHLRTRREPHFFASFEGKDQTL